MVRTTLIVLTLVGIAFIAINRQRLYLRDPLGAVYRNGARQAGGRVFINYSNDVLVQSGDTSATEEYIVQKWNGVPGTPAEMKCVRNLACLAPADHAPMVPLRGASPARMTDRQVSFTDGANQVVQVTVR